MNTDFTEIVQAAQSGDQRAFEALYNLTKDSSYFVAFSITKNENDALDIMQDSYLKVFNNISNLNQPNAFEGWLNRIVANTAKNYIAKKKPMLFEDIGTLSNETFDETELNRDYLPEQSADSKETSRLLMEIIDRLSEEKRLCILMYYYQEMSVGEIAETLQLPVSTVKYKLLAARADIKKEVEKLEKDGTKLYALFPFALFPAQFKNLEKEFVTNHTVPAYGAVHSCAIASDISAVAATSAAKTGFLSTLMGKIVIALTAILLIGGGITAAIVAANFNSKSDTTKITEPTTSISEVAPTSTNTDLLTTEQAIEKMKSVGTDESTFVLDGVVYTLPCPLQEFLDNGWVIGGSEANLYETGNLWPDNVWDFALIRSNGAHPDCRIIAYLKNTGQERADMKDCNVHSILIEMHILPPEQDNSELILSGGLLFDNAVTNEAVIGACGTPDKQQSIGHSTTRLPDVRTYYTKFDYPTMEIYVNSEPNDASKYNYHFCRIFANSNSESDTAKGTEPTTSVSQVAPTSTNTDLLTTEQAIEKMKSVGTDEATFVLDGVVYTLPCSLQEFSDNGWVIENSDADRFETESLWPDSDRYFTLKRSDGTHPDCNIVVYVKNTNQERAALKYCNVQSIRIEMHILPPKQDNSELILSGGLLFNNAVTNEAVIGACGTPEEQRNIGYGTTDLPDVDTKYTEFDYPTMELCVNSEPNDASKYNYHFCRIFAKTEGEE